jgi:alanine racemase
MNTENGFASTLIHIDLAALQKNYRELARLSAPAECGAAVKANAYGMGISQCAHALWDAGCRTFFVALLDEAATLRKILPGAIIYVLNGLMPGAAAAMDQIGARPALSSLDEIEEWAAFCNKNEARLPAAIHIESGINRMGLTQADVETLSQKQDLLESFDLALIISHLASGDRADDGVNANQLERFNRLRTVLPNAPASIANSPGIFNGDAYHLDMTRPGISLYGGNPFASGAPNPMAPVVRMLGVITQSRNITKGESVGYGSTWRAERDSRIAVISTGYADGYPRALSSMPDQPHARVWIDGHFAPVIGRVSMDMITVDVTSIPDEIGHRGDLAELMGRHVTIDEFAKRAGTLSYEIFTGFGSRAARVYSTD